MKSFKAPDYRGEPTKLPTSDANQEGRPNVGIDANEGSCRGSAKGRDSNALRHEQSKRPAGAKVLSGRAGRPPSFSKFTLPIHNRQSICFQRLGARVLLV